MGGVEPLAFVDQTSIVQFDNSSISITSNGMQFTKGHVLCNRDVEVEINSTDTTNGAHLGDGTVAEDMLFELNPGSSVRYTKGHLVFDVVTDGLLRSRSTTAQIIRSVDSTFYVTQDLTLSNVTVDAAVGSVLTIVDGKTLNYDDCIVILPEGDMKLVGSRYNQFTQKLSGNQSILLQNGSLPLYTVIL